MIRARAALKSPVALVAVLAMVAALGGTAFAAAGQNNKDEVTVVSGTGAEIIATGSDETSVTRTPMTISLGSFVQRPGEVVLVTGTAEIDFVGAESSACDARVVLSIGEGVGSLQLNRFYERGPEGGGGLTDSEGLPAPTVTTTRTLEATVWLFAVDAIPPCDASAAFRASLRYSIVTYRN